MVVRPELLHPSSQKDRVSTRHDQSVQASSVMQHQVSPDAIQAAIADGHNTSNMSADEAAPTGSAGPKDYGDAQPISPSPGLNKDLSEMSGRTAKNKLVKDKESSRDDAAGELDVQASHKVLENSRTEPDVVHPVANVRPAKSQQLLSFDAGGETSSPKAPFLHPVIKTKSEDMSSALEEHTIQERQLLNF